MKIAHTTALFGFYGVGNYGDDLMAWMIADHLASVGRRVAIHSLADRGGDSLRTPDFLRRDFRSDPSIEATLDACDSVVYGGGGLLVSHAGQRMRRFARHFRKEEAFLAEVRRRGLPLAVLSVGGDGSGNPDHLDPFAIEMVRYAGSVTVRNRSDLDLLARLGVAAHAYPDVVWSAAGRFGHVERRHAGLRIGLDLYPSMMRWSDALAVLATLQAVVLARPSVRFVCLDSTHACRGRFGGIGRFLVGRNVERYRFSDFRSDLAELHSLDLLLSSRLHVPMVALQYGVPFLSVMPEGKTRLLLESVGLDDAAFGRGRLGELRALLGSDDRLREWLGRYRFPECASLSERSLGHFRRLDEFLPASPPAGTHA